MLVSTTGSFQLVHSQGEVGDKDTPVHSGATDHTGTKMEWKTTNKNRKCTIRQGAHSAERSRIQTLHTKTKNKKVKEKYFQKHDITFFFFISYIQLDSDINSSTRSIYFYYHFKVPLIFFWVFTTVQAKHTLQSAQF